MTVGAAPRPESFDQPSGLLPVDPPARGARWAGGLLLTVALAALGFATFVRLPETLTAPCQLVAADGEDPVQAPLAAEIAAVRVEEGQTVEAGAVMFELRSDEIREVRSRLAQCIEDQRAVIERARRLDEAHTAALASKDVERVQAERELVFREQHLATIRDLVRRAEQLAAAGSLSPVEMLSHKLLEAESLKNRVVTETLVQQLEFERQELAATRERQRSDERAELEKLRVQIAALEEQLQDTWDDVKVVRAPYAAVVLRLVQRTPGGRVAAGAELGQLARVDARPRVRLRLPEAGVPRLLAGQSVQLRMESYPPQRYGMVPARLAWISPAPVACGGERGFIAFADLLPVPGEARVLRTGMRGEARIRIGRQTLLERALDPLRVAREHLRDR